jgi:hypothetical protein
MSAAGAVVSLVLLEWTVGWIAAAAWTQSWSVVRRGHFRIIGYCTVALAALAFISVSSSDAANGRVTVWAVVLLAGAATYLAVQFSRTDVPGTVVGGAAAIAGLIALVAAGGLVPGWPVALASFELIAGALLLGAVTNGMLLGHWYLNQPGLKPWALARLTALTLVAVAISAVVGVVAADRLSSASTDGAVLGIPGFGDSFGAPFFVIWLVLLGFTGVVVWLARRCIKIRSIQSATGLYYVAILTAGVSEFLVRYLMVNSA